MTLLDMIPSLQPAMLPRLSPAIWPRGTEYDGAGRITLGGVALTDIADRFGTPTYVLDEAEIRARCRAYRKTFPQARVYYAGKALMIRAVADWVIAEGLSIDVCSGGELEVALSAGVDPKRLIMHGAGRSCDELTAAVRAGAGRIVLDSLTDIALLAASPSRPQPVLLRLSPGIDVHGHPAVRTGVLDQKFGFPIGSETAAEAVRRVLARPDLELVGLHCHLGSQIHDPDHYGEAIRRLVGEMAWIRREHHHLLTELDLGGGHAVAYRPGDAELNLTELADIVEDALDAACARHRFPRPAIAMEPGRAVVARAGVTVYRVMSIKQIAGGTTYVTVDGGMNDNLRVALYGAQYEPVVANRRPHGPWMTATVAGRYCESGDVLARDVRLPADLHPGDVLAVPCTGAYHHSLSASYNCVGRPPVVAVRDGCARELVRRETTADLLARDIGR
ncbi:diaminopimelate decarboxylase [Nocardia jinanensis]|uniref:Diaminopimelate decarboxylase n=1 Tax=Nocardia jinanensis TaxID=382504 RepID=A0A917VNL0_9NOCA|nr:diaminopimelate decarboxylase [Nocardia jinanensis]GGK98921.1 diaminopimelate decarboxylase [Nocardia jinanensis]